MVIKLRDDKRVGDTVRTSFFLGEDIEHLHLAGSLLFHIGEWQEFGACLLLGASQMCGHVTVLHPDSLWVVEGDWREAT